MLALDDSIQTNGNLINLPSSIPEKWENDRELVDSFYAGLKIDVIEIISSHKKLKQQPSGQAKVYHNIFYQTLQGKYQFFEVDMQDIVDISITAMELFVQHISYLANLRAFTCSELHDITNCKPKLSQDKVLELIELSGYDADNFEFNQVKHYTLSISAKYNS